MAVARRPRIRVAGIEVFDVCHIERVLGQGIATPFRQLSQSPSPRRVLPTPRLSPFTVFPLASWRLCVRFFLFARRLTRSLQVDRWQRFWYSATARLNREH
jgi:hypothetical protein